MQIPDVLTCAMTMPLAAAATWAACRLRHGRQLKAMQRRIDKLHQARLLYDRHGAQVRRQLDHLKRELDLQRAQQPWAPTPPPADGPASAPPRAAHAAGKADPEPPAADGFAQTLPMHSGHGGVGGASSPPDGFAPTRPMHVAQGAVDGPPSLPPDGFAPTRPMPRPARPERPAFRTAGMERPRQVG